MNKYTMTIFCRPQGSANNYGYTQRELRIFAQDSAAAYAQAVADMAAEGLRVASQKGEYAATMFSHGPASVAELLAAAKQPGLFDELEP